jgi:hypothetical protein
MPREHGVAFPALLGTSLRAASIILPIILLPEAAASQTVKTCPGLPGKFVILENQPYALCAGAPSVNFNEITYAKCAILHGNSISLPHNFPFPSLRPKGNINTVNQRAPQAGGYIVSTYSPPAGATGPAGDLAVYTCEGGSYAQCDGGLCFTSTTGKTSPLWGDVTNSQIVCSCPIQTSVITFQVMGPFPCPTTAAEFDSICGTNGAKFNSGATIYIGAPLTGAFEKLAACLNNGQSPTFNNCTRPPR